MTTCRKAIAWHHDTSNTVGFSVRKIYGSSTRLKDLCQQVVVKADFVIVDDVYNLLELKEKGKELADCHVRVESDVPGFTADGNSSVGLWGFSRGRACNTPDLNNR